MAEREIARFEPAQVAQHLGLAVVGVEDRMGQEIGFAIFDRRLATGGGRAGEDGAILAEDIEEHFDVVGRGRFVERNADAVRSERAQIAVSLQAAAHETQRWLFSRARSGWCRRNPHARVRSRTVRGRRRDGR